MNTCLPKTAEQLQRHYNTLITGDVHPVDHPVAKGDAREHGWRELFRRFLPNRFGVKSGFIIDSGGLLSEQIDCIIYRKDIGVELYSVGHHTVIPVEAVFAAFEVKPKINSETLKYAQKKATSVSQLTISNYWLWPAEGVQERQMGSCPANGAVIFGLLADSVGSKLKWKVKSFKNTLQSPDTKSALFITVDDGCVSTFKTAYPTDTYELFDGEHALLNQLIKLVERLTKLETERCMNFCYLTKYARHLDDPKPITI